MMAKQTASSLPWWSNLKNSKNGGEFKLLKSRGKMTLDETRDNFSWTLTWLVPHRASQHLRLGKTAPSPSPFSSAFRRLCFWMCRSSLLYISSIITEGIYPFSAGVVSFLFQQDNNNVTIQRPSLDQLDIFFY